MAGILDEVFEPMINACDGIINDEATPSTLKLSCLQQRQLLEHLRQQLAERIETALDSISITENPINKPGYDMTTYLKYTDMGKMAYMKLLGERKERKS